SRSRLSNSFEAALFASARSTVPSLSVSTVLTRLCDHAGAVPISVMARVIKTVFPRMLMFTSSDGGSHISLLIPLRRAVPTAKLDGLETLCRPCPGYHPRGLRCVPAATPPRRSDKFGKTIAGSVRNFRTICVMDQRHAWWSGRDSILATVPKKDPGWKLRGHNCHDSGGSILAHWPGEVQRNGPHT